MCIKKISKYLGMCIYFPSLSWCYNVKLLGLGSWQFGQILFSDILCFLVFSYFLEVNTSVGSTKKSSNFDRMFKLADLLEGVSVDCMELSMTPLPSNYTLYNIA